jgi:hypothetical protein
MATTEPEGPITVEERMDWHRQWHKEFGLESLIKHCAGLEQHLSDKCKEYRAAIKLMTKNDK